MRKFSIPYNNEEPKDFLSKINRFKANIENIYFGYPGIGSHVISYSQNPIEALANTQQFLELTRGKFKRLLTFNMIFDYHDDNTKRLMIINQLTPLVEYYNIEGVIVCDFSLGVLIHQQWPNLDIQTSCNTFQFNLNSYRLWHDSVGTTTFNPPREILRTPQLLKHVKSLGFKLKCIVNEACIYGCPQNINHACYIAYESLSNCNIVHQYFCERPEWKLQDILKTNFILPRWLNKFDNLVDVYKLAGRSLPTDKIITIIDAYVNERDDVFLEDIISSRTRRYFHQNAIRLSVQNIPDKLLTCQCASCDTCTQCADYIRNQLANCHVLESNLKYKV